MRAHRAARGDEGLERLDLEEIGARPDDRRIDEEGRLDPTRGEDLFVGPGDGPVPVVYGNDEVAAAFDTSEKGVIEPDEVVAEGLELIELGG